MSDTPCQKAHEILEKMNELMEDGKMPTIQEMHEYNAVNEFCMNMVQSKIWNEYREETRGVPGEIKDLCSTWVHEVGEHWTLAQTNTVASQYGINFTKFTDKEFWCMMNVAYSDHKKSFSDNVKLYCDYTYEWLVDEDSYPPHEKMENYYKFVVKH